MSGPGSPRSSDDQSKSTNYNPVMHGVRFDATENSNPSNCAKPARYLGGRCRCFWGTMLAGSGAVDDQLDCRQPILR